MTVGVRVRFEVFKRDRFTCQYCGKTPPDVLLEADHIIPRAAGGTDEITNLTTACQDCNRGKSAGLLQEGTAPIVNREAVDELRERLEQAAAYTALVGQQAGLIEKQRTIVNEVWARAFGARAVEESDGSYWRFDSGQFPNQRSITLFLRRLPVQEILAAIDITASRHDEATELACRLFYKMCWRRIKGESGPIDGPGITDVHANCVTADEHAELRRQSQNLVRFLQLAIVKLSEETGVTPDDVTAWLERESE